MPKLRNLVIDRRRWGTSTLRDPSNGTMCCLGFLARECGITTRRINGLGMPADLLSDGHDMRPLKSLPKGMGWTTDSVGFTTPNASNAANINDSSLLMKEKEKKLIALFRKVGWRLSFKGKART